MMDDRMVDGRQVAPDDAVTDVDRPDWDPHARDDDELARRSPDERNRWGEPQYAPGAPNAGEALVEPEASGAGAVGGAVVGGAGGALAGGAVAGPPGAVVGGVLGAAAGMAAGAATDRDSSIEDAGS